MKKFTAILLSLLLVFAILPINASANTGSNSVISVKLVNYLGNKTQISVKVVGSHSIKEDQRNLASGNVYTVKVENGSLKLLNGSSLIKNYGSTFTIDPSVYGTNNIIYINDKPYIGSMTFRVEGSYVRPSNTLKLEDYLKGVVPSEMYASWPLEALKAQAVTARTYATNYLGNSNINDSQSYQVFGGYIWGSSTYANSTRAVEETRGQIVTYNGRSIKGNALFYSSNGGMKLSNRNTWGTTLVPYLIGGKDPYDPQSGSSYITWDLPIVKTQINLSGKDLKNPDKWWAQVSEVDTNNVISNIKNWMYKSNLINQIYEMKVTDVTDVKFTTSFTDSDVLRGQITINYILRDKTNNTYRTSPDGTIRKFSYTLDQETYDIRSIVGYTNMYGPYIKEVINESSRFVVRGGGYGHGIGMSQWGANAMATQGFKYSDILSFYYPGTEIAVDNTLIDVPVKMTSVSTNKVSPQVSGSDILVTALASGGTQPLYKFNLFDGKEWKVVQDYSESNNFNWKPQSEGNYKFSIHVKDRYSNKEYDDYRAFEYSIVSSPKAQGVSVDKRSPQIVNSTIKLTTHATGGTEKLYKYNLYDGEEWTVVRDYSTDNTFTWTPQEIGNYKFSVHVKDVSSSREYDDYVTLSYDIVDSNMVRVNSLLTDKNSPQPEGSIIKLTAEASGGTERLYKFHMFDGKEWKILRDYAPSNEYNWTPPSDGEYKLVVHVKDSLSTKEYDDYTSKMFTIEDVPVRVQSLNTSLESPQLEGTTIKLTANAVGGTEKLYKFHMFDGKEWKILQDYAPSNEYNWVPPSDGEYKLVVHVKDRASTKEYDDYSFKMFTVEDVPVRVQNLNTSLESPQPEGTTIKLTANAVGGTERLYKFHMFDGKEWKVLRDYTQSNEYNWTPPSDGEYKLVVHVKDKSSKKDYDSYSSKNFTINHVPVKMTEITKDLLSPQAAKTRIKLTAHAEGGSEILYKFNVFDGIEWQVVQDYRTTNDYTWIPSKSGDYKISVHVKDKYSTKNYDDYIAFEYKVVEPVSVNQVNYTEDSNTGEIVIRVGAIGGTEKLYKYWVLKPNTSEWVVLQDYSSSNNFNWKPEVPGEYKISVHVKDINSINEYDDYGAFNYTR